MEMCEVKQFTPGGRSTVHKYASRRSDSGESATSHKDKSECLGISHKIKYKQPTYLATFNVNSLLKTGKLKHLTDTLKKHKILITAVQETRFVDTDTFDSQGFRIYKGKVGNRVMKNMPHLGTAFIIDKTILHSIVEFDSQSERISSLTFKSTNKMYTIVNAHAPINEDNKKNKEKVETFWNQLDDLMQKIPDKNNVILLGDFNAQIGKEKKYKTIVGNYPAHNRTNRNGIRLIELCQAHNLILKSTAFKKLPRKQKTWVSPNPNIGEFQLDHVAIKKTYHKEIMNVRVLRGANLDSDHYLSKIKFKVIPKRKYIKQQIKGRKYSTEKLLSSDDFTRATEDIQTQSWENIKENLINKAEQIAPLKKIRKHAWWSMECDTLIETRRQAWQQWQSQKTEESRENFIRIRKMVDKSIKQIKNAYGTQTLMQIDEEFTKNNTRSFYRTFKQKLSKYSAPTLQFRDVNGAIAHNNIKNCRILAEYFERLLNCEPIVEKFEFTRNNYDKPNSEPPTIDELQQIISELRNDKASGENQIVAELWKKAHKNAVKSLQWVFDEIWKKEDIPVEWKTALIHPLHKKGSKTDPNNYRGISLLDVTYKILSKVLLMRAEPQLDPQLGEYQGGFRKGRSCIEQIFNLKNIMAYQKSRKKMYVITFIDFKKAYDSIDRESLLSVLEELGLDKKTTNIIKATITNTFSKVKFMGELSDSFEIKTGVRQGDGLSPLLFNCALEKVVREWKKNIKSGIRLGCKKTNLKINSIAFADDMALFAETMEEAREQILELKKQAAKIGLKISFEKTKIMTNNNYPNKYLKIQEQKIEIVKEFKYLGEWISWNADESKAMESRKNKLELAFQLTKETYNKKSLSWGSKIKHYKTVIKPEALYAAETLTMNRIGQTEKLEIKERKILRKIIGTKFQDNKIIYIKNETLYKKIEKLSDTMRKRRINFYGHLCRMDSNRLTKQIFDFFRNRKTKPNWFKEIEKDLIELKITENSLLDRTAKIITKDNNIRFQDKSKIKPKPIISEEERKRRSERMKSYWEQRKVQHTKK